jgi:methionyl-tRNA synthetase
VLAIATQGINLFRVLLSYLAPVLPQMSQSAASFLGTRFDDWNAVATPLLGSSLGPYQPLATRLDSAVVASLVAPEEAPALPSAAAVPGRGSPAARASSSRHTAADAPGAPPDTISIEEFARIDLRVARVAEAAAVEGSDKLLRLTLELAGGELRTVFSGIRTAYRPEQLLGRLVVVVANLAPRKMRFGISQGMVLCASDDSGGGVFLVEAATGAEPGMKVS